MGLHCCTLYFFASLKYDLFSVFQVASAEISKQQSITIGKNSVFEKQPSVKRAFSPASLLSMIDQLGSNIHNHVDMKQMHQRCRSNVPN